MTTMEYLPKSNEQLLLWLKNFSDQLTSLGGSLGITPAEVSSLNALILDVKTDIRGGKSDSDLELKKQRMLKFLNDLISKMKNHPSFNENVHGGKLGVQYNNPLY